MTINGKLTPIRAANNRTVADLSRGNTKISQLDTSVLIGENIGAFDISMYDALIV
jgi:hypothetical protein